MCGGGPMTAFAASQTSRVRPSIALAACLLAACGSESTPPTPAQPSTTVTALRIIQPVGFMKAGQTLQLVATATLTNGRTVTTGFEVRWASADETIATVNGTGLVTARADGSADITATSGAFSGSETARVRAGGRTLTGFVTQTPRIDVPVID